MARRASSIECRSAHGPARTVLAPLVGRSMPIEPPILRRRMARAASDAPRIANPRAARYPSTSISVIAGVGEILSSPPANRTIPLLASSRRSFQPASQVHRSRGREVLVPRAFQLTRLLVRTFAIGRFHGSLPGIASRVTSILSIAPSVTPVRRAEANIPFRYRPSRWRCARWCRYLPGAPLLQRQRGHFRRARSALQQSRRPRPAHSGSRRCRARRAIQSMS